MKNDTIIWQYEKKILYRSGKADFVIMIDAIKDRRSIRRYRTDEVPRPYIEEILRAGTLAPSSKNRQPWKFTVVQGEAKKEMLHVMEDGLNRGRINPLLPESRKLLKGAAIENMTLAATELGLGSLWICDTYFAYDELTEWLGDAGALYVALAVGYADENPAPRPRKDISCVTEWRQEAEA